MKFGIADTMFARFDMYSPVEKAIKESNEPIEIVRFTVPGVKDLPVACKKLFEEEGCDIIVACGMPGKAPIDKQCAHEATQGLQRVMLDARKFILEVFVHEDESEDPKALLSVAYDRCYKHAQNALALLKGRTTLSPKAGTGERQGFANAGPMMAEGGK